MTIEDVKLEIEAARESMDAAIDHLVYELTNVRAGKANPSMLDSVSVEYYGSKVPVNQTATVTCPDSRSLMIDPWEKNMLGEIEKAIFAANLGLTPQNDGKVIRINIPILTKERREQLVKQVKGIGEQAKISIRSARKDANDSIKKLVKDGLSEDMGKDAESDIQDLTNDYGKKIDKLLDAKEKDLMEM